MKAPTPPFAAGLKSSAVLLDPPATRTLPVPSVLNVWFARANANEPVVAKTPTPPFALGSNSSALESCPTPEPPATRTFPEGSRVAAVW